MNNSQKAKELGEAMGMFIKSLEGRTDEEAIKAIDTVERQMNILLSMPDEDVEYLSKSPEKMAFDLEAYGRHDGTWEKIKLFRSIT